MTRRILTLAVTVICTVVFFVAVLRRETHTWNDFAIMVGLGFCLGIDVCRLIHWHVAGRYHADR